jgi:hypothetical protein
VVVLFSHRLIDDEPLDAACGIKSLRATSAYHFRTQLCAQTEVLNPCAINSSRLFLIIISPPNGWLFFFRIVSSMMNLLMPLAASKVCALHLHIAFLPNYARKHRFRILAPSYPTQLSRFWIFHYILKLFPFCDIM